MKPYYIQNIHISIKWSKEDRLKLAERITNEFSDFFLCVHYSFQVVEYVIETMIGSNNGKH